MAIKKSVGTYMSVDAAAAVEQNREVIDRIRETVQRAAERGPRPIGYRPLPAAVPSAPRKSFRGLPGK
jgi:hypothetical protein